MFVLNNTDGYALINHGSLYTPDTIKRADIVVAPYSYYIFRPYTDVFLYGVSLLGATNDLDCIFFFYEGISETSDFFFEPIIPTPELVTDLVIELDESPRYFNSDSQTMAFLYRDGYVSVTNNFQSANVSPVVNTNLGITYINDVALIPESAVRGTPEFICTGDNALGANLYKIENLFGTPTKRLVYTLSENTTNTINSVSAINGLIVAFGIASGTNQFQVFAIISEDEGETWNLIEATPQSDSSIGSNNARVVEIVGNTVYAQYNLNYNVGTDIPYGVHVSNDRGNNWDDNVLYSVTSPVEFLKMGEYLFYWSSIGFKRNNDSISSPTFSGSSNTPRNKFAMGIVGSRLILAGQASTAANSRPFVSDDNGDSWTQLSTSNSTYRRVLIASDDSSYYMWLGNTGTVALSNGNNAIIAKAGTRAGEILIGVSND